MPEQNGLRVGGKLYNADTLTFRELREARDCVRNLVGDPSVSITDVDLMDFAPVLVYLVERRDNPDYTLDHALDLRFDEEPQSENGAAPPTEEPVAPKKTPARSGAQK